MSQEESKPQRKKLGIFLSGGGARGAYQAGVLQALVEISGDLGIERPFPIITGVSAGAVNAAFLAAEAHDLKRAVFELSRAWAGLRPEDIFSTNLFILGRTGFRLMSQLSTGYLYKGRPFGSFLNTRPLRQFLERNIGFENIQKNLDAGYFEALGLTAFNYRTLDCKTFVQASRKRSQPIPRWSRVRRHSQEAVITSDHVMGSSAIPLFFPAVPIDGDYYGDGLLRNVAPVSPPIHMGCEKLLIIGVKKYSPNEEDVSSPDRFREVVSEMGGFKKEGQDTPSIAKILGILLNSIFFDSIEMDLERMRRINRTVEKLSRYEDQSQLELRPIPVMTLEPSQDLGGIAREHVSGLPASIRFLLRGMGSMEEASEVISYLLFDGSFTQHLIQLGYQDVMNRRVEVESFLNS